jgi:hypothetical protein
MAETTNAAAIDARPFWRTLGERMTGVPIVTARGADAPVGFLLAARSRGEGEPLVFFRGKLSGG